MIRIGFSRAAGAIEAMLDAKKAGKLRFIGFTGHKSPQIHLHMLETADKYGFSIRPGADAAQRNGRPFRQLRNLGSPAISPTPYRAVLAMKTMGDANFLRSGVLTHAGMFYTTR